MKVETGEPKVRLSALECTKLHIKFQKFSGSNTNKSPSTEALPIYAQGGNIGNGRKGKVHDGEGVRRERKEREKETDSFWLP